MAVVHPRGEGCNKGARELGSRGEVAFAPLKEEVKWPDISARFASSVGGKERSSSSKGSGV
jgi:hypothetical protein